MDPCINSYNLADNTQCKTQYLLFITYIYLINFFIILICDELSSHTTVALAKPQSQTV